jgi:hypothetical protein
MHAQLVSFFSVLSIVFMLFFGHFSEVGIVLVLWAIHRHWVKVTMDMTCWT